MVLAIMVHEIAVVSAHGCSDSHAKLFSGVTDKRANKNKPMLGCMQLGVQSGRPLWLSAKSYSDVERLVLIEGGGMNRTVLKLDRPLADLAGEGTELNPKVAGSAELHGCIREVRWHWPL